jgi:sodium/proline symporter
MANSTFFILALLLVAIGLLIVAWRLLVRIHVTEDFVLARRRLPAWQTGLGLAINCAPMWLLLSVALFAYAKGLAAVWMAAAMLVGLAFNWWLVAPKLRALTAATQSNTLSQWFTAATGDTLQIGMRRSIGAIVLMSLGLATVTLLQWSAQSLSQLLGVGMLTSMVVIVLFLVLFATGAGLWSASTADAAQATLALLLLLAFTTYALFTAVDGGLWPQLLRREPSEGAWFAGYSGVLSVALVVGVTFGAFAAVAQPPAIARYLSCRDDASLQSARLLALTWVVVALMGALVVGWIARIAAYEAADGRMLLARLASGGADGAPNAALLTVFVVVFAAACVSPLLSIATHVASDWSRDREGLSLAWVRVAFVLSALVIGFAALRMPAGGEERLWLSWHALSASLGPLLLVRLTGKRVRPGSSLGALWAGFVLTLLFYLMPDTPGDLLERCLPFIAGMGIALSGGERRQNPDRADRGDKTVHDHLPI